ncbi:MAG: HD domain-containing protein [Candidatus Uhrbacteria bacterium]|nr:HD domain-containing protein [Candidatus Uhrbacteria bacterium]
MDRKEFFEGLNLTHWDLSDRKLIQAAYELAKLGHAKQTRDGGGRYFEHPREVARLLIGFGYLECETICTGLLHDGIEDTYIPEIVYIQTFGACVYRSIETLSKSIPHNDPLTGRVIGYIKKTLEEYFTELMKAPKHVRATKCCDRLHNLRTLGGRSNRKKREQIDETVKYILPLADATDPEIAKAIRVEIALLEADLMRHPLTA